MITRTSLGRGLPIVAISAVALVAVPPPALSQQSGSGLTEHATLDSPADLDRTEAIDFYASIVDRMQRGYALSKEPAAIHYRGWHLYNDSPYRSDTHGNRYVNNYANTIARRGGYGRLQEGDKMPAGSIIAKDSLTITRLGQRRPGALFIMEKLHPGESPSTGDWRYVMIMPDGSYFGDTLGPTAANIGFCFNCHKKRADTDYLFFIPRSFVW